MKKTNKDKLFERMGLINPDRKVLNEEKVLSENVYPNIPVEYQQKIASEIPSIAANYQNRIDDNHIRTITTVLWENYGYKHYIKSFSELEKFVEDWVNKNMPEEVQRWKDYENTMGTFDAKLRNPIQNEEKIGYDIGKSKQLLFERMEIVNPDFKGNVNEEHK